MKLTQETTDFKPLTITIETSEELYLLYNFFDCAHIEGYHPKQNELEDFGWKMYEKLKPFYKGI